MSYSFLFCVFTAAGRLPLGMQYAQVSCYVTLSIPLHVGVYFHLLTLRRDWVRSIALSRYLAMAMAGSLPLGIVDQIAEKTSRGKAHWKACYLKFEHAERCNQLTGFRIHPTVHALESRLQYLKAHQLNLYLESRTK